MFLVTVQGLVCILMVKDIGMFLIMLGLMLLLIREIYRILCSLLLQSEKMPGVCMDCGEPMKSVVMAFLISKVVSTEKLRVNSTMFIRFSATLLRNRL